MIEATSASPDGDLSKWIQLRAFEGWTLIHNRWFT